MTLTFSLDNDTPLMDAGVRTPFVERPALPVVDTVAKAKRKEMTELSELARVRRNQAFVTRLAVRAIDRLFEISGWHVLFDSSPI